MSILVIGYVCTVHIAGDCPGLRMHFMFFMDPIRTAYVVHIP